MAHINVTGEVDYMHNWKDVANDDVLVSVAYLHRPNHCFLRKTQCRLGDAVLADLLSLSICKRSSRFRRERVLQTRDQSLVKGPACLGLLSDF